MDSSKAIKMSLFPERAHSWIGVSMDCNKHKRLPYMAFNVEVSKVFKNSDLHELTTNRASKAQLTFSKHLGRSKHYYVET